MTSSPPKCELCDRSMFIADDRWYCDCSHSRPNLKMGDIVRIKNGRWRGAHMKVLGGPVFKDQWWVPVHVPLEGDDPTFFKASGLELVLE